MLFLSTPSARRATSACSRLLPARRISIHALREEGDLPDGPFTGPALYFYPRPPRGGRRFRGVTKMYAAGFLSTPSARRATSVDHPCGQNPQYFYPRPPRGGRLYNLGHQQGIRKISIHALREEGDRLPCCCGSAPPISIHALREEGDVSQAAPTFQPMGFLSTPSARRATSCQLRICFRSSISIHALREEGDSKNGEKHLRFCFIIKRSAQIWKSFSKNIQKTAAICTERLENMVRRRRKRGERFPFAPREQARKSARLRIQTGDELRYARPWSYSCCPVDKTADCPDRGR